MPGALPMVSMKLFSPVLDVGRETCLHRLSYARRTDIVIPTCAITLLPDIPAQPNVRRPLV